MESLLLRMGVPAGGFVFIVGCAGVLVSSGPGASARAALATAAAAAGLALWALSDRAIGRRAQEHRMAAVEAASAAGEEWVVPFRWSRWLLQMGVKAGAALCGGVGAAVFLRLGEIALASLFLLFFLVAAGACVLACGVGFPAARAGHFLRLDRHGLFHFGRGYIPWSKLAAVDLMRMRSGTWRWHRGNFDYYLVATFTPAALQGRSPGPLRYLGNPRAASLDWSGHVVLPLEYAAEEPHAVLAAARAIAGRAGVPVASALEIKLLDGQSRRPYRPLLPAAAVGLVCLFIAAMLNRGPL